MDLLKFDGIHKSYTRGGMFGDRQRHAVLKGVHLSIAPGSCIGLLGRSGSGKSTLGRIALGIEAPDAGTVLYDGAAIDQMPAARFRDFRRNNQVVFQNSLGSVNPRFTAGQIVAEPLKNFKSSTAAALKEKINDLLTQVGLRREDADKYPHQFSGGELQRVCIARAIALNPRLIVLDEAVSSLDMVVQSRIIDLLMALRDAAGIAYLFISHDLRVLAKIADRLAVLHDGRIVEDVDLTEPRQQAYHPALIELIGAVLPPISEWSKRRNEAICV
ncbi:MAG: ATP-binding cassette domain-containing protein [Desulfatitalea sp.]|nr:ATP-binding cassette domain-containing protein [Desulfatitalea sp.]NNK02859.1 ATP-binding cassette domain-containing protein [Desulfatitalea sp.]